MKPVCYFFLNAYIKDVEEGYSSEIEYVRNLKPLKEQSFSDFIHEYVWVVLCAAFKEQYARVIFDNFWEAVKEFNAGTGAEPFDLIRHPGKKKAIIEAFAHGKKWYTELLISENPIEYIGTLPYMGNALTYHLARNLGIDTVKPDRHMLKLAEHFGYSSPMEMCQEIQDEFGDAPIRERLGVIDVILWRYMNLTGGKIDET